VECSTPYGDRQNPVRPTRTSATNLADDHNWLLGSADACFDVTTGAAVHHPWLLGPRTRGSDSDDDRLGDSDGDDSDTSSAG
jgi:hypothetical protein